MTAQASPHRSSLATVPLALLVGLGFAGLLPGLERPLVAQTIPVAEPVAEPVTDEPVAPEVADEVPSRPPVEAVKATLAGPPGHRDVREIRRLVVGGGRLDWSRQGGEIAFDRRDQQGFYRLYSYGVENGAEKCLSCDRFEWRKQHVLDPVWHPSGEHLVVQVQGSARRLGLGPERLATPLRGIHSELWVLHRDGKSAWQLTRGRDRGAAVLDPHFSWEGGKLVWSERLSSAEQPWGDWGLRIGRLEIKRGVPRLKGVELYDLPGLPPGFVGVSEFTPNDRGLMIAASRDRDRSQGRELFRFHLEDHRLEPLTTTPGLWNDRPVLSPSGDGLVWASDRNIPRRIDHQLPYRGDLWLRIEREGREERLTYFNERRSDHYLGEALIDDISWSPRGDLLALHVVYLKEDAVPEEEDVLPVEQAIYLITFDPSYRR